jgi:hypothetical protein
MVRVQVRVQAHAHSEAEGRMVERCRWRCFQGTCFTRATHRKSYTSLVAYRASCSYSPAVLYHILGLRTPSTTGPDSYVNLPYRPRGDPHFWPGAHQLFGVGPEEAEIVTVSQGSGCQPIQHGLDGLVGVAGGMVEGTAGQTADEVKAAILLVRKWMVQHEAEVEAARPLVVEDRMVVRRSPGACRAGTHRWSCFRVSGPPSLPLHAR